MTILLSLGNSSVAKVYPAPLTLPIQTSTKDFKVSPRVDCPPPTSYASAW